MDNTTNIPIQAVDTNNGSTTPATAINRSELSREFDSVFASLLMNKSSKIDSSTNNDILSSSSLTLEMLLLYEELLSKSLGQDSTSGSVQQNTIHINQFDADLQTGGDGRNADCGPTSLTMALHALGFKVADENQCTNTGQVIDMARKSMVIDPSKDGFDESGNRSDVEHNTFTDLNDVIHGATAAGAFASKITADSTSIRSALLSGSKVVISGTFVGKSPLPWMGDRGSDNQSAPGGATGHIVAVTGYDNQDGSFIIDDPARQGTMKVDAATLEYFMQGNAGAVAIRK